MNSSLAIHGGPPLRTRPFPGRRQFGEDELAAVRKVFEESWASGKDFGYQGPFEERYARAFADFLGGGYVDAVSSGTATTLLCLAALELPKNSKVIVSPVTDPGSIAPVFLLGHQPIIADSTPNSFSIGLAQFKAALEPGVSAAIITHVGGIPTEIDAICAYAKTRGVKIIEDCSHAHGATLTGTKVGCFGDIAGFSTMFSKNHSSGGCGGLIFCKSEELYWKVRAYADRGKPFYSPDYNLKDPRGFLFPALNFNQDEISCAIGLSTLGKLPAFNKRRREIIDLIQDRLKGSRLFAFQETPPESTLAPFFFTIRVRTTFPGANKLLVAQAVAAEGVPINPDYKYVVAEWPWVAKAAGRKFTTPNATNYRASTFNLLFHERFSDEDALDIAACLKKVEDYFAQAKAAS